MGGDLKFFSINQKLIAAITAISLLIFTTIAVVDWFRIRQSLEAAFLSEALATARGLEVALASGPRLEKGQFGFSALQKALLNNAELLTVILITPLENELTVALATDPKLVGQNSSQLASDAYRKRLSVHETTGSSFVTRELSIATPLFIARSPKGVIELRFTLESVEERIRTRFAVDLLFLSFFIFLLSSSVYLMVRWFVIRPIWDVRNQIQTFASSGELQVRINNSADEIGELSQKFQEMASNVLEANEKQNQLQRLEAIGQLTGGVAHDFNNLLAIIGGNAELLEDALDSEASKELLTSIIRATERGSDLTHQLLAYARKQSLFPQEINLGELGSGIVELLQRTLGETIKIEWRDGHSLVAFADTGQLENALLNLAINARDAMPEGGTLTIEAGEATLGSSDMLNDFEAKPGDFVVVRVTDDGTGMSPHVLEHAFEPFFTTKGVGVGSGLGLSMVYGFVRQSKGQMTIQSEIGRGTTVLLYLPKATHRKQEGRKDPKRAPEREAQGETILVVEDEPGLRDLVARHLEKIGYKVLQAPDGPIALEILAEGTRVDLLLSDVVLPNGINGVEVFRRARSSNPALRCLFMSGHAVAVVDGEEFPRGVELLNKPFALAELSHRISELLQ